MYTKAYLILSLLSLVGFVGADCYSYDESEICLSTSPSDFNPSPALKYNFECKNGGDLYFSLGSEPPCSSSGCAGDFVGSSYSYFPSSLALTSLSPYGCCFNRFDKGGSSWSYQCAYFEAPLIFRECFLGQTKCVGDILYTCKDDNHNLIWNVAGRDDSCSSPASKSQPMLQEEVSLSFLDSLLNWLRTIFGLGSFSSSTYSIGGHSGGSL
jgi:hypothetical protein